MVTRRQIREYAQEIGRRFRPRQIILFGSYVYGKPTADSDVDLLVVMPHRGSGAEQATRIRLKLRAPCLPELFWSTGGSSALSWSG